MNRKSRLARWAMFDRLPVSRLSMPMTEYPRSSSASARCDPMNPAAPVMTTRGMEVSVSVGVLLQALQEREPHDFQIEADRPVLDVVQVVFDALLEGGVAAPAVHLRPAGDAGLHLVPQHVLRDPVLELLDEERTLRTGADDRHVAAEHVPELRQLVDVVAPQPAADRRGARVVVSRPDGAARVLGIHWHRPELIDSKGLTVQAHADLRVERRAGRAALDEAGDDQRGNRANEEHRRREDDVANALGDAVEA